jgi:hypothetical protein
MTPEREAFLKANHPVVFGQLNWFECDDGWFDIIDTAALLIGKQPGKFVAAQIKEKFGGLRFYISSDADETAVSTVYAIIDMAEHLSFRVCEVCGRPGTLRRGGWVRTLCDTCHEGRNANG